MAFNFRPTKSQQILNKKKPLAEEAAAVHEYVMSSYGVGIILDPTKNNFKEGFTLSPNNINMPSAKAISVAIGIPKPIGFSGFNPIKISAGTTIPPIAATTGNAALCKVDNSPISNSLLISSPTIRKNKDIKPSSIQ